MSPLVCNPVHIFTGLCAGSSLSAMVPPFRAGARSPAPPRATRCLSISNHSVPRHHWAPCLPLKSPILLRASLCLHPPARLGVVFCQAVCSVLWCSALADGDSFPRPACSAMRLEWLKCTAPALHRPGGFSRGVIRNFSVAGETF